MNPQAQYSVLPPGTMFKSLRTPELALMKHPDSGMATVLVTTRTQGRLYCRDEVVPIREDELVTVVERPEVMCIFADDKAPLRQGPAVQTWKPGRSVNLRIPGSKPVPAFAGLYVYAGLGLGCYHSTCRNEVMWCTPEDAEEQARLENVQFVYKNGLGMEDDRYLQQRREAPEADTLRMAA